MDAHRRQCQHHHEHEQIDKEAPLAHNHPDDKRRLTQPVPYRGVYGFIKLHKVWYVGSRQQESHRVEHHRPHLHGPVDCTLPRPEKGRDHDGKQREHQYVAAHHGVKTEAKPESIRHLSRIESLCPVIRSRVDKEKREPEESKYDYPEGIYPGHIAETVQQSAHSINIF